MVYNSSHSPPTLAEHRRDGCEFAMALNNNEYVNYAYTQLYSTYYHAVDIIYRRTDRLNANVLLYYCFILKSRLAHRGPTMMLL